MRRPRRPALRRTTPRARWRFRLYVAGGSLHGSNAYMNLKRLCDERLDGDYSIEVVDLLANPERARSDQVVAIPTTVRRSPKPVYIAIGDLSDHDRAASALHLGLQP